MKKLSVLLATCLVVGNAFAAAAPAPAAPAAPAKLVIAPMDPNEAQCLASAPGAKYDPKLPTPRCVCPDGYVNYSDPNTKNKKVKNPIFKATDACYPIDVAKRKPADKPKDNGKPEKPTPFTASLDPDVVPSVKPGTPVEAHLSVTSGAAKITQIKATCDNCLMNGKMLLIDNNVRPPKVKGATFDYPITLTPADPNAGGPANLMVTVITTDGGTAPQFPARITWESKVPCAGGTVLANACTCPANTILNATKTGCDPIVCTNGTVANNACTCPDNMVLNAMKNGCEPVACANGTPVKGQCTCVGDTVLNAAKNACVKAEVKDENVGSGDIRFVTYLDGVCGRTDHFRTCNTYASIGVEAVVKRWGEKEENEFALFAGAGLGTPGATKHGAPGEPDQKRWLSAMFEAGVQLRTNNLMFDLGVNRQSRGTRNSLTDPVSVTTSGKFGLSYVPLETSYLTMRTGLYFMVGPHGELRHPTDPEVNGGARISFSWY